MEEMLLQFCLLKFYNKAPRFKYALDILVLQLKFIKCGMIMNIKRRHVNYHVLSIYEIFSSVRITYK